MAVQAMGPAEARARLRDLLDRVLRGEDFVIERYGKSIAALIPYEDYIAIQEELEDIRAARRAAEAHEEWKRDRSVARPYREAREELIARGLLEKDA